MAFEQHIANRRETHHRQPASSPSTFGLGPAVCIEIAGELNERSSRAACEQLDTELGQSGYSGLVSLDRVTRTQWAALCRLVAKIQAINARGLSAVRIIRPSPSIRLLIGTIALGDSLLIDPEEAQIERSVLVG
ncbi:MAG TPA: hypothetical protein VN603_06490 [Candidatus Acidoferrales bacterium]|nr:hypothetical protein [Candidatus Acidoferrales bacterium]